MQNKIFDVIHTKTNFNPLKIDFIIFAPAHAYKKRPLKAGSEVKNSGYGKTFISISILIFDVDFCLYCMIYAPIYCTR